MCGQGYGKAQLQIGSQLHVCAGLGLELGPTSLRVTGSTWSLVGGVGEPGWAKSPVGDVWAGLYNYG